MYNISQMVFSVFENKKEFGSDKRENMRYASTITALGFLYTIVKQKITKTSQGM